MITAAAYEVTLFGIDMKFDPVAFTLPFGDGWNIYWYGICIALGFILAVVYCFIRAKSFGVNIDRLTDVVLVTTPLAILCARLYYIAFYKGDMEIKNIWDFLGLSGSSGVSGLAIYGGVIGAVVFGFIMCKLRKVNVLDGLDLAASGFFIGQSIGRWGNFFNQEAFGSLTKLPGMMSNEVIRYIADNPGEFTIRSANETVVAETIAEQGLSVHPCFFYESVWCLLGFILLHFVGKRRKFSGQLALIYGVWYGFGRMIIEGLRTDSLYWGPLKVSQWLSGALMLVCGILLIYMLLRIRQAKVDKTYTAMFDEVDPVTVTTVSYYEGEGEGEEGAETENSAETETKEEPSEEIPAEEAAAEEAEAEEAPETTADTAEEPAKEEKADGEENEKEN